jgi:hypothetical protein
MVNGDIVSLAGTNGVYGSPGAFPTSYFQASNYFRDIVFVADAVTNAVSLEPIITTNGNQFFGANMALHAIVA